MIIDDFRGEYRWLSNFHISPVVYDGIVYPSAEHAYHSAKNPSMEWKKVCATGGYTPREIKKLGGQVAIIDNWDAVKLQVMTDIQFSKYLNTELQNKLVATYPAELIEGNNWGDTFWGVEFDTRLGENNLGKILMKVRSMLVSLSKADTLQASMDSIMVHAYN